MGNFPARIAEDVRYLAKKTIGHVFWLKKTLTSSDITSAGTDITGTSTGGELALEEVVVKADSTGLAGAGDTSFRIVSTNAKGTTTVLSVAISELTTGKTVDLSRAAALDSDTDDAWGINKQTILENGAKLTANMLTANGTGSGTIDVYVKFRRLDDKSDVLVA